MKENVFWESKEFWIGLLLLVIGLLQMFIQSPISDKKMERYAIYGLKGLRVVVELLNDENKPISIKPPKRQNVKNNDE